MADLAEDAPSTLEGVIQPVIRGEEACIHAIVERQWLLHVGGAGTKSKFLGSVARVRSVRRAGCNHFGIAASIDRRQQCAGGEAARSEKADANGFVARGDRKSVV